jgi:hypothetical protein
MIEPNPKDEHKILIPSFRRGDFNNIDKVSRKYDQKNLLQTKS